MQNCKIMFAKLTTGMKSGRLDCDIHWPMLCRLKVCAAVDELTMLTDQGNVKLMRQAGRQAGSLVGATDGVLCSQAPHMLLMRRKRLETSLQVPSDAA